jgi:uncharacterized protein
MGFIVSALAFGEPVSIFNLAITEYNSIIASMILRDMTEKLETSLADFPAVALLGPRQVGKTTLARLYSANLRRDKTPKPEYLDLENPSDREKLSDPLGYLTYRADRLVIIDEVQRAPELFSVLRGLIDTRIFGGKGNGHFLLLGSASIDLLKQSTESLAGRIAYLELPPLTIKEIDAEQSNELWCRGGFPRSLLARSDNQSATWRANFIKSYLERDIPQLGPRIAAETLRRFWIMLAHRHGSIFNAAELARSLAVDGKTVAGYLDLMIDLLLMRRLQPLHANVAKRLTKSPRLYVRDSGLLHSLLGLDDLDAILSHPIAGASWEGFVIETLINCTSDRVRASFYRTAAGAEIDLVLDFPGGERWAIEVKRGIVPSLSRGFYIACDDVKPDRAFVVHSGQERYPKGNDVEAIGLRELAIAVSQRAPI